jgi:16S rRNA (uracil1498-N3)-methyltransferase
VAPPHFFVDRLDQPEVRLNRRDSHHALRSLRLRPNEDVSLSDGRGVVGLGRLRGEHEGQAVIDVLSTQVVERPVPFLSVGLAPPANEGARWALQKLTELGVDQIVEFEADRSVRRLRPSRADSRRRHIIREAAMQSRRAFEPDLITGPSFGSLLDGQEPTFLLAQTAPGRLSGALPENAERIRLLVGPEGGWSEGEVGRARGAGVAFASLGPTVLRTETAAVVGATVALARYGRLG